MVSSWMELFIAALVGGCVGWSVCSVWMIHWIDAEREKLRMTKMQLSDCLQGIAPLDTPLMRELTRLQEQERWNRERA